MGRKWIIYWYCFGGTLENDPSKMNEIFAKNSKEIFTLGHNNWNESMYCENIIMIYVL